MDVGAKDDVVKIVHGLRDEGIGVRRRLDRAGDGAVARRPHPGHEEGRDRARILPARRQQGPAARSGASSGWRAFGNATDARSMGYGAGIGMAASATAAQRSGGFGNFVRGQIRNIAPFAHAALPGRCSSALASALLPHLRQSRQHPDAGLGHGDHRGRADLRDPLRRDRPLGRLDRQRHRHRRRLFTLQESLREHRQRCRCPARSRSSSRSPPASRSASSTPSASPSSASRPSS